MFNRKSECCCKCSKCASFQDDDNRFSDEEMMELWHKHINSTFHGLILCPEKYQTKELWRAAIKRSPHMVEHVPKKFLPL